MPTIPPRPAPPPPTPPLLRSSSPLQQVTRPAVFARKFESTVNQEAMDILDAHLYGHYAPGTQALQAYWESLYEGADGSAALSDLALTAYASFLRLALRSLDTANSKMEGCRSGSDWWMDVTSRHTYSSTVTLLVYCTSDIKTPCLGLDGVRVVVVVISFHLRVFTNQIRPPSSSCLPPLRYKPIGYPLSVHVYFFDDRFQGYLVRQEVQAVESEVREVLEVWAVPQATLLLDNNLREFERLKILEVRSRQHTLL